MSATDDGAFSFQLPVWFVGSRAGGRTRVATGRVGGKDCLLLFTDAGQARRCVRDNHVSNPRIGKLDSPQQVHDFLLQRVPEDVTHVAFDVGRVGDAAPAVVPWQELAEKMQPSPGLIARRS